MTKRKEVVEEVEEERRIGEEEGTQKTREEHIYFLNGERMERVLSLL